MAKTIKGSDIIQDNHLANAIADAEKYKSLIVELDKVVTKLRNNTKSGSGGSMLGSVAEIKAVNEAYKNSNTYVQASIQLNKQLKESEDEVVKGKIRLQQATAIQKKLLTEEIALENKQIGTLEKLSIENKKLTRERQSLNLETQKGTTRLKEINAQIDKNNKIIRDSGDAMTKQRLNIGNYAGAVNKLTGALTQLGLGFSAFTILRDAFTTIVDFEKATASLSAITGATGNELENLKGKILGLATEMKVGVTETTKLFEIVGSQMPQLLQDADGLMAVSKSAIILSKASGDSIESSTLALASVMNQFSLGADQAERAMNVLAAGSLVGSAGITDVSDAMKNFGSVASGANISVEESVALIEVLGKFGVVGAESGTKLRGSILKLQQASFGYASGQFEVNDALDEAKAKFDSLGSAMEQDAFLQKTFGAENISTGRILLSNIALFEEYTKGVTGTNVATEQAAINSDTMATVVNELKAAWQNLVVKWSEGSDVLGGLKDVLRFVADNLESIIGWVVRGISVWASYRVALALVNKEGTGFIQVLGNMVKGLAGANKGLQSVKVGFASWVGLAAALLPVMIDLVKATWEMYDRTTALEKVTEKYNGQVEEERAKMDTLRLQILATNAGSAQRQKLITEINDTYGTTLTNLSDETQFMNQLWEAYQNVNAEMEKRIKGKLIEEELTELYKAKRQAEKELKEMGDGGLFGNPNIELYKQFIDEITGDIAELNKEMFAMGLDPNQGKGLGGAGKLGSKQVTDEVDATAKGIKKTTSEVKELNTELNKLDQTLTLEELKDFLNRNADITVDDVGANPEMEAVDSYLTALNKQYLDEKKLAEEAAARRKKMAEDSIALMKKITDALTSEIDKRIEKEKEQLAESEQTEDYFRQLAAQGNVDAANSVKAEQIAQAKQALEIERLEKKKRNLMILTTGLEAVSQKINAGDSNAFANAGSELAEFIAKLPQFYEGTESTVADALGRPHLNTSKDGYLARVHGNEMIHGAEQSAKLQAAGFNTTSDIANAAMAYSQRIASGVSLTRNDSQVVSELREVKDAIKKIQIPEHDFNWDDVNKMAVHTVKVGNKTVRNHFKTGGLFS